MFSLRVNNVDMWNSYYSENYAKEPTERLQFDRMSVDNE